MRFEYPISDTTRVGNLLGKAYKDHIDGFKEALERTKEAFNQSVNLEVFRAIDGIGKRFKCSHETGRY